MNDQQQSRADALTDESRDSIEYAIQVLRQVEAGDGTFVGQCTDAISGLESILDASPVEQHEAAPAEGCTPADAQMLRAANHDLAAENDALRRALRSFASIVSTDRLSWAMVEYCVEGDPEKQTFQRPQMQRAFNRAADLLRESVPNGITADIEPDWVKNGKLPVQPEPPAADERAAFDHEVGNVLADAAARGIAWMAFKAGAAYARASSPNAAGVEPVAQWQLRATLDRAPRTDVTGGVLVPRADLEAIYAAMNHLGDVLNEMDAVEAEDEAATEPGFAAIRRALSEGCDGAPSADAAAAPADEPTIPAELHPDTAKLVRRFARALANKLLAAQRKYGYSDNWMRDGWADECRAELMRHIHKGDPRDVAAYCAFLWHHNESTAPAPADAQAAGMFVKRSMFGPWIEVDKPEPGVVRLYFGPQPQADAQPVEAVAIPACYTQAPLALLPRVADLLHLLSFATIHTPSEGDEPQIRRALHDIKAMIAAAPQPPAQAHAREGLTDAQREAIEYAARWLEENVSNRYAYTATKQLRALLNGADHAE
ncbi:hypothetical protein [Burkholderia multivorans]|uniref:hypothetical protein n=1 Tax=Burkholderia multivorans TaxID=87883 RepID=UPI0021C1DD34|nr:hypothetical protein [Burkholderia multivorans]